MNLFKIIKIVMSFTLLFSVFSSVYNQASAEENTIPPENVIFNDDGTVIYIKENTEQERVTESTINGIKTVATFNKIENTIILQTDNEEPIFIDLNTNLLPENEPSSDGMQENPVTSDEETEVPPTDDSEIQFPKPTKPTFPPPTYVTGPQELSGVDVYEATFGNFEYYINLDKSPDLWEIRRPNGMWNYYYKQVGYSGTTRKANLNNFRNKVEYIDNQEKYIIAYGGMAVLNTILTVAIASLSNPAGFATAASAAGLTGAMLKAGDNLCDAESDAFYYYKSI
ncbi:hypothetical protein AWM68_14355 [Fictibacillus phosphorivorans]|uniref:Bacterial toxin 44 domain-containing protein n=1 Tax=Fictibacillus phosphorivorans TaxID=1221500 RepID=A0A165N1Q9_9BACL|nr:geobacillin-26 family protein [Fictibacillus phosphorivorans]KZE64270.1 hypothetical protein AWM68_14355 [Fictibacillus phosphorivorans]